LLLTLQLFSVSTNILPSFISLSAQNKPLGNNKTLSNVFVFLIRLQFFCVFNIRTISRAGYIRDPHHKANKTSHVVKVVQSGTCNG